MDGCFRYTYSFCSCKLIQEDVDETDTSNNIFSKTMTFTDKPAKSADIRVGGYQISTTLGGFRTVYSVSGPNAEVESFRFSIWTFKLCFRK